jgi:hypothetical protein
MKVYLIRTDDIPNYNKNDFFECFWLSPSELLDRISSGDISKHDLPIIIKNLF